MRRIDQRDVAALEVDGHVVVTAAHARDAVDPEGPGARDEGFELVVRSGGGGGGGLLPGQAVQSRGDFGDGVVRGERDGGVLVQVAGKDGEDVGPACGEGELWDGQAAVPEGFDAEPAGLLESGFDAEEGASEHVAAVVRAVLEEVVLCGADVLQDGVVPWVEGVVGVTGAVG